MPLSTEYDAPLSASEQRDLCFQAQAGDIEARNRLIATSMRFVVKAAVRYQRRSRSDVDDLVQEGAEGVLEAIRRFDPKKHAVFITYAAFWIYCYISRSVTRERHGSRSVLFRGTQYIREVEALEREGIRHDDAILDVARKLKKRPDIVEHCITLRKGPSFTPIDAPPARGGFSPIDSLKAPEDPVDDLCADAELRRAVQVAIANQLLTNLETEVLRCRWLTESPMTLAEVGERVGRTRERMRQIEVRLFEKLRAALVASPAWAEMLEGRLEDPLDLAHERARERMSQLATSENQLATSA
jgi:RNA polymerase sigma-32 factor